MSVKCIYIDPHEAGRVLNFPPEKWAGNCYSVACMFVEAGLIEGKPVFGRWTGPLHPTSMWYGSPITPQHGWIDLGLWRVCDPTRFCFMNPHKPEVYLGPEDHYDFGGNQLRKQLRRPCPCWEQEDITQTIVLPKKLRAWAKAYLPAPPRSLLNRVTFRQLNWLANLTLEELGDQAKPLFSFIMEQGHSAYIPIDNRRAILGVDS